MAVTSSAETIGSFHAVLPFAELYLTVHFPTTLFLGLFGPYYRGNQSVESGPSPAEVVHKNLKGNGSSWRWPRDERVCDKGVEAGAPWLGHQCVTSFFFYEEGTLLKALKPSLWSQAVCFCHDLDETTSE